MGLTFSFTPYYSGQRTEICGSDNGRVQGAQNVYLGRDCLTSGTEEKIIGRVQHEILHAVGSLHEMNR